MKCVKLIASDLIKVDNETINVDYTNERAKQLNLIEKLESDKPKVIREKKKPVEKIIEEETIQEPVTRSSRSNKGKAAIRYDDEFT